MSNFFIVDEFGTYADDSLGKAFASARSINISAEMDKLIEKLLEKDFGIKEILNHDLFKLFPDDKVQEVFSKTGIPIGHWHHIAQDEIPELNLERLVNFAINTIHQGDLYTAIRHYDERTSGIILSVLAL